MPHEPTDPTLSPSFPTDRRAMLAGIGGLAAGAMMAGRAQAGPLNPPAGPITPTPGPEPRIPINATNTPGDADSLFVISQPGSYYLTGNITGLIGKHGIKLTTGNISIDLCGFQLVGVPAMGDFSGVWLPSQGFTNFVICNGIISGWGSDGLELRQTTGSGNTHLENLTVTGNGRHGISAGNGTAIIRRCTSNSNTGSGIRAGTGCVISDCNASGNGTVGILASDSSSVSGCAAFFNLDRGFSIGPGSSVTACAASANAIGFGSTANFTRSGSVFKDCASYANNGDGFRLTTGNTVSGCAAYFNDGHGFSLSGSNIIAECNATSNYGDGIQVTNNSTVRDNHCIGNGNGGSLDTAGFRATSSDNRIEGNVSCDNARGFTIAGSGNFVARNTCSGSTIVNWDVAAGNTILVVSATTANGIFGNGGGTSPGSTNPNANYSY